MSLFYNVGARSGFQGAVPLDRFCWRV